VSDRAVSPDSGTHRADAGAWPAAPGVHRVPLPPAYDVARDLTWTRRDRAYDDLDVFNQALAALETRAHLELLVARDQARAEYADGVRRYAAVSR
jgi:hypothetical protein